MKANFVCPKCSKQFIMELDAETFRRENYANSGLTSSHYYALCERCVGIIEGKAVPFDDDCGVEE